MTTVSPPDGWDPPSDDPAQLREQYVRASYRADAAEESMRSGVLQWEGLFVRQPTAEALLWSAAVLVSGMSEMSLGDAVQIFEEWVQTWGAQRVALTEFWQWSIEQLLYYASEPDQELACRLLSNLRAAKLISDV